MIRRVQAIALSAAAFAFVASSSSAGMKTSYDVFIDNQGFTGSAYGSMGAARASADNNQSIGCSVISGGTSENAYCSAQNSAGAYASCHSSKAFLVNVAR